MQTDHTDRTDRFISDFDCICVSGPARPFAQTIAEEPQRFVLTFVCPPSHEPHSVTVAGIGAKQRPASSSFGFLRRKRAVEISTGGLRLLFIHQRYQGRFRHAVEKNSFHENLPHNRSNIMPRDLGRRRHSGLKRRCFGQRPASPSTGRKNRLRSQGVSSRGTTLWA